VCYLLADEVGLGKTIEAGLIMRGLVRRTSVVSPKGIATQWVVKMQTHFNEQFQLVLGGDIGTLQRLAAGADHRSSAWSLFDQVIVSLDSVKPMDKRWGWTAERVVEYNRSRFEDLITAGWDLVIYSPERCMIKPDGYMRAGWKGSVFAKKKVPPILTFVGGCYEMDAVFHPCSLNQLGGGQSTGSRPSCR
jgi:hypothetical protein